MAALTRLGCFIVCPHLCGDCDPIVPSCRCLVRGSGRTLHREKRVLQDEMQSAEWATALMGREQPSVLMHSYTCRPRRSATTRGGSLAVSARIRNFSGEFRSESHRPGRGNKEGDLAVVATLRDTAWYKYRNRRSSWLV